MYNTGTSLYLGLWGPPLANAILLTLRIFVLTVLPDFILLHSFCFPC